MGCPSCYSVNSLKAVRVEGWPQAAVWPHPYSVRHKSSNSSIAAPLRCLFSAISVCYSQEQHVTVKSVIGASASWMASFRTDFPVPSEVSWSIRKREASFPCMVGLSTLHFLQFWALMVGRQEGQLTSLQTCTLHSLFPEVKNWTSGYAMVVHGRPKTPKNRSFLGVTQPPRGRTALF